MTYGETRVQERLYSLKEIISITGHANSRSAYQLLRKQGHHPIGYRAASRAPVGLYSESVVREVFARQLARTARIKDVDVCDIFEHIRTESTPERVFLDR